MTTCACGCGAEIAFYGGKPNKFIKGHHRRKSPVDYIVDQEGCWIWQGWKNQFGYALMQIYTKDGKRTCYPVHRAYYEKYKGPIPEGMEVDHACENHSCVNPDHLEAITLIKNRQLGRRWVRQHYLATIFLVREFNIITFISISPIGTEPKFSVIFISQLLLILTKSPNAKMLHVNANPVQIGKVHDRVGQAKGTTRDLFAQIR